jgi:hypothetical protein
VRLWTNCALRCYVFEFVVVVVEASTWNSFADSRKGRAPLPTDARWHPLKDATGLVSRDIRNPLSGFGWIDVGRFDF